jgi:hypothetical protein
MPWGLILFAVVAWRSGADARPAVAAMTRPGRWRSRSYAAEPA